MDCKKCGHTIKHELAKKELRCLLMLYVYGDIQLDVLKDTLVNFGLSARGVGKALVSLRNKGMVGTHRSHTDGTSMIISLETEGKNYINQSIVETKRKTH